MYCTLYTPFQPKTNDLIIAFIGYNLLKHASSSEKRGTEIQRIVIIEMHNVYVRHHAYLLVTYCNKNKGWFWVLGGFYAPSSFLVLSVVLLAIALHWLSLFFGAGWWKLAFGWCRHDLIPPQGDTPSVCTRSLCIMIFVTMNTSTSNTDPWIQTHNCSFLKEVP